MQLDVQAPTLGEMMQPRHGISSSSTSYYSSNFGVSFLTVHEDDKQQPQLTISGDVQNGLGLSFTSFDPDV
jgi:hypothetical protein